LTMADNPAESAVAAEPSASAGEGRKIKKYDFLRPERLSLEQGKILGRVHEIACQRMAKRLQAICRCEAQVEVASPKETGITELQERKWAQQILAVVATTSEESRALVSLDSGLTMALLDRLLGGVGEAPALDRPLTELERQVAVDAIESLLNEYAQGWSKLAKFSPTVLEAWHEILPEETLRGSDWAVETEFSVKMVGLEGKISICLLLPGCEKLLTRLTTHRWAAEQAATRTEDRAKVMRVIEKVELPVTAVLGTAKISLADLLGVSAGDIVCLEAEESSEVQIWAGGKAAFLANPVALDGHIGVRVSEEFNGGGR